MNVRTHSWFRAVLTPVAGESRPGRVPVPRLVGDGEMVVLTAEGRQMHVLCYGEFTGC